jgi:hypothetical protein
VNTPRGAGLDNAPVIERAGEYGDRLHLGGIEHLLEIGIEEAGIQFIPLRAPLCEVEIRFDDSGEFQFSPVAEHGEKAVRMVMRQTDDGEADGLGICIGQTGAGHHYEDGRDQRSNRSHESVNATLNTRLKALARF